MGEVGGIRKLEGEYFNLHHFVKAYAVQKGIATGFLREKTLTKPHQERFCGGSRFLLPSCLGGSKQDETSGASFPGRPLRDVT
jgi:hypothetical protein